MLDALTRGPCRRGTLEMRPRGKRRRREELAERGGREGGRDREQQVASRTRGCQPAGRGRAIQDDGDVGLCALISL